MADAAPRFSPRSSKERSLALPLTLVTLAGEEPGSNSAFGCELQFVQKDP